MYRERYSGFASLNFETVIIFVGLHRNSNFHFVKSTMVISYSICASITRILRGGRNCLHRTAEAVQKPSAACCALLCVAFCAYRVYNAVQAKLRWFCGDYNRTRKLSSSGSNRHSNANSVQLRQTYLYRLDNRGCCIACPFIIEIQSIP